MTKLPQVSNPPSGKLAIERGEKIRRKCKSLVEDAIECGATLIKVKEELPHGEFTTWVNRNMTITLRQCQKFMSIRNYLLETKSELGSLLGERKENEPKTINELAKEAGDYKLRLAAEKRIRDKPNKESIEKNRKKRVKRVLEKEVDVAPEKEKINGLRTPKTEGWKEPKIEWGKLFDSFVDFREPDKVTNLFTPNNEIEAYSVLGNIMYNYGDKDTAIKTIRLYKQRLHPDKNKGNEELFKLLMKVEDLIK